MKRSQKKRWKPRPIQDGSSKRFPFDHGRTDKALIPLGEGYFKMDRGPKKLNLILILAISLLIPFFSTYSGYDNLSESIFLSNEMSFEDPDDEDLSILQNESRNSLPATFFEILPHGSYILEEPSFIFYRWTCCSQAKPILRC